MIVVAAGLIEADKQGQLIVIAGHRRALARRLVHHSFFDPLTHGEDRLSGTHGNASIPNHFSLCVDNLCTVAVWLEQEICIGEILRGA